MAPGPQAAVAVQSAGASVRQASGFTYVLSLMLPARSRPFFWAWYAYLRWVDDTVDDAASSRELRSDFLKRQTRIVHELYEGKATDISSKEEILAALVTYDAGRGRQLRESLLKMLAAMQFDVERQGQLSSYADLRRNFDHEVTSYLYAIGYFCEIDVPSQRLPGSCAANAAKIAHILRDFLTDCDEGQFNISREAIDCHELALPTIRSDIVSANGRRWVAASVLVAERGLQVGLLEAAAVAGARYPLIVGILVAKYKTYLDQIRADGFVLKPRMALHRWAFAKNLLANICLLLSRKHNSTDRMVPARLPAALLSLSKLGQVLLLARMLPYCNRAVVSNLNRSLNGPSIDRKDLQKLRRRFVAAYWLGRSSCATIAPVSNSDDRRRAHCAGLVYAFWSLAVLELDSLIDAEGLSRDAAEAVVSAWISRTRAGLDQCRSPEQSAVAAAASASLGPGERFRRLADAFQTRLGEYRGRLAGDVSLEAIAEPFLAEASTFLQAQIDSLDQNTVDPQHDWNWYLTKVLNQKTLGFALAPLALWSGDAAGHERRNKLQQAFLELNAGYCHWQMLDDLADIKDDTREGRVTAPGFILLSQGAVARKYLEATDMSAEGEWRTLLDATRQSMLVEGRFLTSPLCDPYRLIVGQPCNAQVVDAAVRCALMNDDGDRLVSLRELARARSHHARSYLLAMQSGEPEEALRALSESRVAERILFAVADDAARIEARERLRSVADRPSLMMLHIIEALIRHCYRKALRTSEWTGEATVRSLEEEKRLFPAE
jgi:phytoene/squalene synthetase